MPMEFGEFSTGGFAAIFVGLALFVAVQFARKKGHLRSRAVAGVLAAGGGLIIIYGMGAAAFFGG